MGPFSCASFTLLARDKHALWHTYWLIWRHFVHSTHLQQTRPGKKSAPGHISHHIFSHKQVDKWVLPCKWLGVMALVEYQLTMWGNGYLPSWKQAKQWVRIDGDELFDGYLSMPAEWKLVCHHRARVTRLVCLCLCQHRNNKREGLSGVFNYWVEFVEYGLVNCNEIILVGFIWAW